MKLKLFILRHALAGERDPKRYPDDAKRPLTKEGVEKMRLAARGIRALDLSIDLMISSPYLRAQQTAEMVHQELKIGKPVVFANQLAPGASPRVICRTLETEGAKCPRIMMVGHEPHLSSFMSELLVAGQIPIRFKKGALAKLAVEIRHDQWFAEFCWMMTCRQLGMLRKS